MKSIKLVFFFAAIACAFLSCKKGGDDVSDCEDNNTTKVTFTNTGTVALRVKVAVTLTPQFEPVDPVVTLDLAPGASVQKEIEATRYNLVWYTNCSASCAMATNYAKTYMSCDEYEEKLGL